ncbi:MAG: hypothetical protein JWR08_1540 [Enterovirga sp.]|jgi:hypothetical protein|nr:hypothetical protein [Enterovirga sp.]
MGVAREKAKGILERIPKSGLSSLTNPAEFESFVGGPPLRKDGTKIYESRQKQMEATNYAMTFCNEFAGEFGRSVLGVYVGGIDLKSFVFGSGKAYAWVDSSSGAEPKYGDIYFTNRPHQHLGVSRGVVGGRHHVAEAGQGGAIARQDYLKLSDSPWNPAAYVGWIDIDLWLSGSAEPAAPQLTPVGTWTVWGDKKRYRWTYTFSANNNVTWVDAFDSTESGHGTWSFQGRYLLIMWKSGSSDLWNLPMNYASMTGIEDMKNGTKIDIQASRN